MISLTPSQSSVMCAIFLVWNWNSYRVDSTNDTKGGVGVFFLPLGKLFPWSLLSSFVTSIFSFLIRFFAISWITKMESMQLHVTRVWFMPIRNIVCIDFLNLQLRDWDYSLFGIETAVFERFFVAQPLCLSSCSKSKCKICQLAYLTIESYSQVNIVISW